jgi:hypothetical protein
MKRRKIGMRMVRKATWIAGITFLASAGVEAQSVSLADAASLQVGILYSKKVQAKPLSDIVFAWRNQARYLLEAFRKTRDAGV